MILELANIKGESKDAGHKGGIEILSFSFGATNTATVVGGGGGGAGKPQYNDFSFMKYLDSSSLPLLGNLASGKAIKDGTLYFYGSGDSKPYLTVKLEQIFITSSQYSDSAGGNPFTESFSLRASKMTFSYQAYDGAGRPLPLQTLEIDQNAGKVS
ncbi:type VI secretion system secreted protein Hcp [Paenibacillus sacheonensis]|nr:type VI secretion system secreted protein Hcp [Paenibacillus sacheonensis]